ncbi:RHS repeat-associated core domain-containing protein [Pseudomonas sp. Bout1]|uniref:RHS repeat-associated core domain-containing protein n=1 Tax=Pseudomonas sp. Bout1 TaxID=3048600 RepID=UPI002AB5D26D|nr:RHS repeat-associated core domain-containing protein [Pseudomonas sp. Bout1]MDY7533849.1 RHS repeat-associated core domain-containing protein [Pseudomonas sp. Bout1]MEB0188899.1 RHS repeat-associated core domain-containing protein [Pseudomonas sp. Bout1]
MNNTVSETLKRIANGGLYSQAGNFLSFVNTGVDVRTGQFTLVAKLPALQANALAGPFISPTLHFSPLASHTNRGFGLGWQLGCSLLDLNNNQLSLITGEQFSLDRRNSDFRPNGLMAFHDQKLRSFVVRQIGASGRVFRVEHKSGDTEWLEVQESSGLAMVVEMRSPQGRLAFFKWEPAGGNQFRLDSVWDERGPLHPLLRVVMDREGVVFVMHPGTTSESRIILQVLNGQLTHLILPDGESRWTFRYQPDRDSGLLFPNEVLGPLGSEDRVQYDTGKQGHLLPPGAPLATLPRIRSLRHVPGAGQPEIYRNYTYLGSANFLGGDSPVPGGWQDVTDNLYRRERYSYSAVETVQNIKGETIATAQRTWNRFHLQTREVITRFSTQVEHGVAVAQARTTTKETTYGDDPNLGWSSQPAWCQLPVATVTRFDDGEQPPREFREETDYDDYGNVLEKRYSDGRVERSVYYPLGGGDGCPDDGSPFVRWLKSQTLVPATPAGGAPTLETCRVYERLPSRKADDVQVLVSIKETALSVGGPSPELIGTTAQSWDTDINSAFFGQPVQSINTLNGFATTTDFQRSIETEGIRETVIHTGHDGLSTPTQTLRNALSGLTLSECNENGLETVYTYDALGRILTREASVGTPYAVTQSYRYTLADSKHQRAVVVEETDITGQKLRRYLDGDGRPVREERQDADITGQAFREMWSGVYDHEGELTQETVHDWLPGETEPIRLTTRRESGSWGEIRVQHQPDGTSGHTDYDPIRLISRHWKQSRTGEFGAETEILHNEAGEVEKVTLREPRGVDGKPGAVVRVESWTFDGLNRPVTHTVVADGQTTHTRTERDVFGRTTAVTREDGSVVRWSYAAQSDGEQPAKVTLTASGGTEQVLAEVTYDGLGRPVTLKSGGKIDRLNYLKGQLPPDSLVQANGHMTKMTYERALDDARLSVSPQNEVASTYSYSAPNGYLTEIGGELGRLNIEYSAAGRVLREHWTVGNDTFTSTSSETLLRRPLSFTDVGGTVHQVEYDSVGRVAQQVSGTITVKPNYDAFGRVDSITTTDTAKGSTLTQALTYDAFGRERSRTWDNTGNGPRQRVVQTLAFNGRDKVTRRRWELAGALQSEEHYAYDARGRLIQIDASGPKAPQDARTGKRISQQLFTLNALDGYEKVETLFADATRTLMTYRYDTMAPDRPVAITHRGVQDVDIALVWDAAGRLLEERRNDVPYRQLEWSTDGLVRRVTGKGASNDYRYDPMGRVGEEQTAAGITLRFYNGDQVINERSADGSLLTLVRSASAVFAESRLSQSIRSVRLTGSDGQGSVRVESDHETRLVSYTAHGSDDGVAQSRMGYAGQLRELESDLYMPGSYRPYDPVLMLFLAPDSESPLGAGGLNRYAYCGGDPVNRVDPDGHSLWSWIGAGVGLVFGAVAIALSAGSLTPVVAPLMASMMSGTITSATVGAVVAGAASLSAFTVTAVALTAVSMAAGLAVPILEATDNKQAAKILGFVSMGTGVAASVVAVVPGAMKAAARVGKLIGGWAQKLQLYPGGIRVSGGGLSDVAQETLDNGVSVLMKHPEGLIEPYVSFFDNLHGRGQLVYVTHGLPDGTLASYGNGRQYSATLIANHEIAPLVVAYPPDQPLILVACYAADSGAAQAVANALQRPVRAAEGIQGFQVTSSSVTKPMTRSNANFIGVPTPGLYGQLLRKVGLGNTYSAFNKATLKTFYPARRLSRRR